MSTADAYAELRRLGAPILTTREAAARLRTSTSNASHKLRAIEAAGLARRLRRGLWTLELELDPFLLPPYLTDPFPAYVSAFSALARHGMIEQLPRRIAVVSLDRAAQIETSVATYDIRHISPQLFDGFQGGDASGYLATPEKALFDAVYLRAAGVRGGGGARSFLPELALPSSFDQKRLRQWTQRINSPRLRTITARGLADALRHAVPASI